MRVEKYYDVACEYCGRHLSSDFNRGFAYTSTEAIKWAREEGFHTVNNDNLCKDCYRHYKDGLIKL